MAGWDANFTQLGLILFFLAATRLVVTGGTTVWRGALAGAALGILFLMNQVVLLVALPWIAFLLVTRRFPPREMLRFVMPFALAVLLVNLPWIIRNYRILGRIRNPNEFGDRSAHLQQRLRRAQPLSGVAQRMFRSHSSREQRSRSRSPEEHG